MRIALVASGKTQAALPAPAQDLYVGDLFRAARDYARAHAEQWFILSAQQGLLDPRRVVAPYRVLHRPWPRDARLVWARRVVEALPYAIAPIAPPDSLATLEWVILAGRTYYEYLLPHLGGHIELPLAHLRIGQQVAWLRAQSLELPQRAQSLG